MSKRAGFIVIFLICMSAVFVGCDEISAQTAKSSIVLADNGNSDYQIVISSDADKVEKFAASELQSFLQQISGAKLPIVTDTQRPSHHEILLGNNARIKNSGTKIDFEKLGKEGFTIRREKTRLVIAANSGRGTMYGVYAFLEDHLGCRWFTSKFSRIPKRQKIELSDIDDTQVPVLDFREVYCSDFMDPVFAGRLRLNGNASKMKDGNMIAERHAGWATWCHTSFTFVPPEVYAEDHSEYYTLIDGKRHARQLCFSHPDILEIATEKIKKLTDQPVEFIPISNKFIPRVGGPIWADAEDTYIDFSQQDTKDGACQCPECKALDERDGSHIGSVLAFINKLAARFPDNTISTLSYRYTRVPPKHTKPAENVAIMLCSFESARTYPIAESPFPADKEFKTNLQKWSQICENLFVWDYVVNFRHLQMPNPNFHIQQSNIKFFIEHNAKGIFSQASRQVGGEFSELRNYLLAKLLWNPDTDVDELMDEFLDAYYGDAAVYLRQYIDLMQQSLLDSKERLSINKSPKIHANGYLSEAMLTKYAQLFDKAELSVADDKAFLARVKTARIPIMYVQLVNEYGSPAERLKVLDEFSAFCKKAGIIKLSEGGLTPEKFEKEIREALTGELAK